MISRQLTIRQSRSAGQLAALASQFKCDVFAEYDGDQVNGKSVMGWSILQIGMVSEATVTVIADGVDAHEALIAIQKFVE